MRHATNVGWLLHGGTVSRWALCAGRYPANRRTPVPERSTFRMDEGAKSSRCRCTAAGRHSMSSEVSRRRTQVITVFSDRKAARHCPVAEPSHRRADDSRSRGSRAREDAGKRPRGPGARRAARCGRSKYSTPPPSHPESRPAEGIQEIAPGSAALRPCPPRCQGTYHRRPADHVRDEAIRHPSEASMETLKFVNRGSPSFLPHKPACHGQGRNTEGLAAAAVKCSSAAGRRMGGGAVKELRGCRTSSTGCGCPSRRRLRAGR